MSKTKKWVSLAVALVMMLTLLAACGGNNNGNNEGSNAVNTSANNGEAASNNAGDTADAGPDISKKVELNWYLLGDAHPEQDKIVAELNKMLEKDLNATIKLNFTTWNDWSTKYNLLLTSGEKIDMIFASTWADYYKLAKQGAFMDLTELLPTYAPQTWDAVPADDWTAAKVGGKIFAVPNTNPEYTPDGWVYREDWRKELGLAELTDLNSIEAYLDAVKTQKKVTPINGSAFENVVRLFRFWYDFQNIGVNDVVAATSYDNPRDIQIVPFTAEYEEWVKKMKTWADKGYWNKNTLSSQQEAGDFVKTNQGAVYWRNPGGAGGFVNSLKSDGIHIEVGYLPFTRFHNYAIPTNPMANGMAIPRAAENPERSLMALDKLRNDPAYFQLSQYGIEGRHWAKADEQGKRVVPAPGIDTNEVPRYDIASWGWRNKALMLDEIGGWEGYDPLIKEFEAISKPDIFGQIYMDYEPVKTELAAVNQVQEQFGKPLMLGLVKNVDAALQEYRDKLKAAGVEKLYDYIKTESLKTFDEKGIQ